MIKKIVVLIFFTLSITGCSSGASENIPQPTKTVYVPVPESGTNSGFQDDLDDIKQTNCRLADDLMFQSLDLSRQARDLESQRYSMPSGSDLSYQLQDQARKLRQQSLNLAFQSDQLRQNC
jgi:hypothetical protein